MLAALLSFNVILPLVPVILIAVLIIAAAGLTRGADVFALLGIGTLIGLGGSRGGGVGRGGTGKGIAGMKYSGNVVARGRSVAKGAKIKLGKKGGQKGLGRRMIKGAAGKIRAKLGVKSAAKAATVRAASMGNTKVASLVAKKGLGRKGVKLATGGLALGAAMSTYDRAKGTEARLRKQRVESSYAKTPSRVRISTEPGSRGMLTGASGARKVKLPIPGLATGIWAASGIAGRRATKRERAEASKGEAAVAGAYKKFNSAYKDDVSKVKNAMKKGDATKSDWKQLKSDLRAERKEWQRQGREDFAAKDKERKASETKSTKSKEPKYANLARDWVESSDTKGRAALRGSAAIIASFVPWGSWALGKHMKTSLAFEDAKKSAPLSPPRSSEAPEGNRAAKKGAEERTDNVGANAEKKGKQKKYRPPWPPNASEDKK